MWAVRSKQLGITIWRAAIPVIRVGFFRWISRRRKFTTWYAYCMYGRNTEESYNITINHDCYYNVLNTCFHKSGFYNLFSQIYWQFLVYFDINWKLLIRRNEQNKGKKNGKTICRFRICGNMWWVHYKSTFYIYFCEDFFLFTIVISFNSFKNYSKIIFWL